MRSFAAISSPYRCARFIAALFLSTCLFASAAFAGTPANDAFANATDLGTVTQFSAVSTTVGATIEAGEPTAASVRTAWLKWTSTTARNVHFNTLGSSASGAFAVFTGTAVNALTPVLSTRQQGTFDALANTIYLIQVSDFGTAGIVVVNLPTPPANDAFANAVDLGSAGTFDTSGDTSGATQQTGEPPSSSNFTVWYKWTAPSTGGFTIRSSNSNRLGIFTGTAVNALTLVASDTGAVGLVATSATAYMIQVDTNSGAPGTFPLKLQARPANDLFAAPIDLGSAATFNTGANLGGATFERGAAKPGTGTISTSGSLITGTGTAFLTQLADGDLITAQGQTKELSGNPSSNTQAFTVSPFSPDVSASAFTINEIEPFGTGGAGTPTSSGWWKWTAPYSRTIRFTHSFGSANFGLFTGTSVDVLTAVTTTNGNDFAVTLGTAYFIAVNNSGPANFSIKTPANDNFASAQAIPGSTFSAIAGDTTNATIETGEPTDGLNAGAASIWYRWTAPTTGRVTLTQSGGSVHTLGVFTGTAVNALTTVASSGSAFNSSLSFNTTSGTAYFFRLAGGAFSTTNISLVATPANNDFANRITIAGTAVSAQGTNVGANKETGEPNHQGSAGGASVWWSWQAPADGQVIISTSNDFTGLLSVYTGTAVNALTLISNGSGTSFSVTQGTLYAIAIDGSFGASGAIQYTLQFNARPANDNFANAIDLGNGATFATTGSCTAGTKEAGEPAFFGANNSIWYKWTAPASRRVQVNTNGSAGSPALGVFTGSAVNLLNRLAGLNSPVQFDAISGTTYFFGIEQFGGGAVALNLKASPANDSFSAATDVGTAATFNAVGDTSGATSQTGEPIVGNGFSIWYKWTAPANGLVRANTVGSKASARVGVFTGSAVNALVQVVNNQATSASFTALSGTVYIFEVDTTGATGEIALNLAVPAANDNFASAIDLGNVPSFKTIGDNAGASTEPGEVISGVGATVWYKWTSPFTKRIVIDTNGSSISPQVGVFTGTALNGLTQVVTSSSPLFSATAGTVYFLQVDGTSSDPLGQFILNLDVQTNDNFASAIALQGAKVGIVSGSTKNASKEIGEPDHGTNAGGVSVWYSWTAPAAAKVTLSLSSSSGDHVAAVYTGSAVNALTLANAAVNGGIGSQTSPSNSFSKSLTFIATAGTTYRIAFDSFGGNMTGFDDGFSFSLIPAPANDDFAGAIALTGAFVSTGTTVGATFEIGEPNQSHVSVWYTWTAPSSAPVVITNHSNLYTGLVGIYTGSAVNALTQVVSPNRDVARFDSVSGTVYRIQVMLEDEGEFTLRLLGPPVNDNFANRIIVAGSTFDVSGVTLGATNEAGEVPDPLHSIWYSWTAPADARVSLSTAGSDVSVTAHAFTGSAVGALTFIPSILSTNSSSQSYVFNAVGGTIYQIAVGNGQGNIRLALFTAPVNDNFANAIAITIGAKGNNFAASKEAGEPNHGNASGGQSVWYTFTPNRAGAVELVVSYPFSSSCLLGVYTGTAVNALTPVAIGTGSAKFTAVAGTTYAIAVDSSENGSFVLEIKQAPANDNFANAIAFPTYFSTTGANGNATKEIGEPAHAGNAGGSSVWWSFTAPETRRVEVNTVGSNFDTLLGVYTGSAVDGLAFVASNDDDDSTFVRSRVQFDAVAGTTYFIAVDGSNDAGGLTTSLSTGQITLTVLRARIAVTSQLTASPIPQVAGNPITFTIVVDGPALFNWVFGDGTSATTSASTIDHVYNAAGNYNVTVTAILENGFNVVNTLSVTVLAKKDLQVAKASVKLGFKKTGSDGISISGTMAIQAGQSLVGPFTIRVGPLEKIVTLTAKGFKTKTESVKITKPKAATGNAKFTIGLKGDFRAQMATLGMTSAPATNKVVEVPVQLILSGVSYEFNLTLVYNNKGTSGSAK